MSKISSAVQAILETQLDYLPDFRVRITGELLERNLYEDVNEVFRRLRGAWKGGKTQAHVFPFDPKPLIEAVIASGELPPDNPYALFPTPPAVVEAMIPQTLKDRHAFAQRNPTYTFDPIRVLEPSAGLGAIATAVRAYLLPHDTLVQVEIDPFLAAMLHGEVHNQDFLTYTPDAPFDYVLMNPPFSVDGDALAYITHIEHAWGMLTDRGVLVAITPRSGEAGQPSASPRFVISSRSIAVVRSSFQQARSRSREPRSQRG
jgi:hypothetical protein